MKKNIVLFLILLLFPSTWKTLFADETFTRKTVLMTLQECLVYARDNSSVNLQNRYICEQARISVNSSAMQFLPYISANTNGSISFGRGIDPETNTYATKQNLGVNFGISMSLPLFDGLVKINNYKISKSYLREYESNMQLQADEVSFNVIKAFYNVVYNEELLKHAQSLLDADRYNLRQTERQAELGMRSKADVEQMAATVAEDEYSLVNRQNLLEMARLELKSIMSWPVEQEIFIDCNLDVPDTNDVFSGDFSLLDLPTIKIAGERLRQKKLSVRVARGNFVPGISVSAGVSTSYYKTLNMNYDAAPFHRQFKDNMGQYISTGISFPIFGRLSNYNNLKKSKLSYKIQQTIYDETIRNMQTELRKLIMNLEGARKEYLSAISCLTAVESSHAVNRRKYELGRISALELSVSNVKLAQARATFVGKQIQLLIQKMQYDYYDGKPYIKE